MIEEGRSGMRRQLLYKKRKCESSDNFSPWSCTLSTHVSRRKPKNDAGGMKNRIVIVRFPEALCMMHACMRAWNIII